MINFINTLPKVKLAIGYGSGVFPQAHHPNKQPMIDLIIAVNNSKEWHSANIQQNPQHYSTLTKLLGSSYIQMVSNNVFPIQYFPYIKYQDRVYKYGVVQYDILLQDLKQWNLLTLAGRLQKPVKFLIETQEQEFQEAYNQNIRTAIAIVALANLNLKQVTLDKFLHDCLSISYIGDLRFKFGAENMNKVNNILQGNKQQITSFYESYLLKFDQILKIENDQILFNNEENSIQQLIKMITLGLNLQSQNLKEVNEQIYSFMRDKNISSSKMMMISNILLLSTRTLIRYALEKRGKA